MDLIGFYFIANAILISPSECFHRYKSKFHRRQSQPLLQTGLQMPQSYSALQPQFPVAYPMYPFPSVLNGLPVGNAGFPYGNPYVSPAAPSIGEKLLPPNAAVPFSNNGIPSGNDVMPADNDAVLPPNAAVSPGKDSPFSGGEIENAAMEAKTDNLPPFTEYVIPPLFSSASLVGTQSPFLGFQTPAASYSDAMEFVSSYSNQKPVNVGSRRRKKNIEENKDTLMNFFEKGKKLLESPTVNNIVSNNELDNNSEENDVLNNNTTFIPLPKGIQLKTDAKSNDSIIHASVNISGSTQKIISFDNNTEIENVVEMQMEKKIEDEKGADKGFEAVQIVETERVKPMVKLNTSKVRRKNGKRHKHRFFTQHRSKRSKTIFDEASKSKFLHNKIGPRFLSVLKRKERVVKPNNLMNRYKFPDFPAINQKATTENTKQIRDAAIYDEKEIDNFMKFFLNEMKKFRKSQQDKKNNYESLKKTCEDCNSFNFLPLETRKSKKKLPYPEHMNVIMNLNMTWDPKTKEHVAKSIKISKAFKTLGFENITIGPVEITRQLKTMSPAHVIDKQSTRFLTAVLFFSVITSLLTISTLVLPKLYKLIRFHQVNSAIKTYKLFDDYPRNKVKDIENEHLFARDDEQLEWQSENGDWLSKKESQIK